ncbi:MAG: efflux RND transporter periplasmic adaptor subunit [Candidatus Daviesbacteria bacterium]|nr:efflux RND transporter periplasmic adaptor subunit [Candidatus Daviesbacteria bacterium]
MRIPDILKPGKKKIFILGLLIIAAITGFYFFGQKKETPLQFANVKKQDIKATVSSSGTLTGKNTVNLKFKSSGKLSYSNVKAGDKVYAGQVIAGLDTQDLAIALQQAQNTLRDKQAIAQKAEDDVKDHSSDESFAQKVTRTTAQAARDSAFDAVKAAQRAFQDAVIISPINGIVTQAIEVSGQIVSQSDLIAQVVDTSAIFFDADIDEADYGSIALGMKADLTLDAYPDKTLTGIVDRIIPQTKTTTQGANVVTVRIKLNDQNLSLVNGLTGQVSIITKEEGSVLTISQEALRDDNSVVLKKGNTLSVQKVTPGISSDTDVEIKDGLSEGETVLLNPPAPGAKLPTNVK